MVLKGLILEVHRHCSPMRRVTLIACCIVVQVLFIFADFAEGPAKRPKLAVMSFKLVGAVDTRVNYLVKPAAFDELVGWVGQGLVVMVNFAILCHVVA